MFESHITCSSWLTFTGTSRSELVEGTSLLKTLCLMFGLSRIQGIIYKKVMSEAKTF